MIRQHLGTTVATYCLLALAGGFSFVLPDELGVQNLKAMPDGTPDVAKITDSTHDSKKTNGSGVYEYLDGSFHPVDRLLFGKQGESYNNYSFPGTIDVPFIHHASAGRFFEFHGCDDAWLFVDGVLARDLGGVIPGAPQHVDTDRLGLVDGRTYILRFFNARRQPDFGAFRLRTNLDLQVSPQVHAITSASD